MDAKLTMSQEFTLAGKGQWYPEVHWEEYCQQVVGDSVFILSLGEATSGFLVLSV